MKTYTLPRSGGTSVEFRGSLIAEGGFPDNHLFDVSPKGKPIGAIQRGHRLELYRTEGGRLILHVWFMSGWENEPDYFETQPLGSMEEVSSYLKTYGSNRIMSQFVGPPAGSLNAALNREQIIRGYLRQYEAAVTDLLGDSQPERID